MKIITDKKYVTLLVYLCAAVYFVSYMTRINYGAVMVEMIESLKITKAEAGMALSASMISYGVGQLISGYLGDKIKAWKIILSGLILTTLMNIMIPFFPNPYIMAGIWFVNGFAQALMWPPIVKIMSSMLTEDSYKAGCIRVSQASSVARILMYLIAPVIIFAVNWKFVFFFSAALSIIMCFVWLKGYKVAESKRCEVKSSELKEEVIEDNGYQKFTPKVLVILGLVMFTIVLQGALRDSVENWMPSFVSDTFNLSSEISILTSVALPIFSIVCFQFASLLNRKLIKNEMMCIAVTFPAAVVAALLLSWGGQKNVAITILCAAVLNAVIHGVNFFQTCLVPIYFARYGKVSFISGLLNSCTYIGSAVATSGIAVVAESYGWWITPYIWTGLALVGALLALVLVKTWNKFKNSSV